VDHSWTGTQRRGRNPRVGETPDNGEKSVVPGSGRANVLGVKGSQVQILSSRQGRGRHPLDGDGALGCFYQRNIPLWPVLAVAGSVSPFKIEFSLDRGTGVIAR